MSVQAVETAHANEHPAADSAAVSAVFSAASSAAAAAAANYSCKQKPKCSCTSYIY